jgi:UMF1 family MFS transporter
MPRCFMIANIDRRASSSRFTLPHIAAPDEMDRVSTAGYAIGYLSGGILLVINLL